MAIYSLRMSAVGKTTQKQPFTAAAHLKYITRKAAVTHVLAERMPETRRQTIAWLRREERDDRKNARVIEKLVVALPRELSPVHQHALVKAFAEALTQGRASWLAAFHTKGKDAKNPHCHIILRDRDFETGRRVMFLSAGKKEAAERRQNGLSAPTTLAGVRELWERCANVALQVAGRAERIDRRSLKEQGVSRPAQVHEGPNIRAMHMRGVRPRSRDRVVRNSPFRRGGRTGTRVVRYREIDRGVTRAEYNDALRQGERATEARSSRTAVRVDARPRPAPEARAVVGSVEGLDQGRDLARRFNQPVSDRRQPGPLPTPPRQPTQVQPPPVARVAAKSDAELTLTELLARELGVPAANPRSGHHRGRGR